MPFWSYILTALAAYLLGSIPTGFLAAKAKGIDIRTIGSGNIGATNAMRMLGKPVGIAVLLADALKGYAACIFIAPQILNLLEKYCFGIGPGFLPEPAELRSRLFIIAGIFAVLGHNYTFWLKFKGGKGVATTAGAYLVLAHWPLLIALVVFILAVLITRYISVGSIAAAIALPVAVWMMQSENTFLGMVTTALGALAIYKHKSNIQRLIAGTENRLQFKKRK